MREPDLRHRLVAILAADAAGYSRLMAADNRFTLAALDAARAVFRTHVEAHSGRVVDMAGDSVLAVFESASGAVDAALSIQEQLAACAAPLPEAQRMRFRLGIHLGDVLEKPDGTVYGDGVNIAARLQAISEPGGTTVSHVVHGAISMASRAHFEDIGEHSLKNIAEGICAYRTRLDTRSAVTLVSDGPAPDFRFGRFELRPFERRLLIEGANASVGGRAFDMLLALVERRERVVSRAELAELVWPGLVVEDNNLAVQVSALRKLLGPQAIATVPGRGYRFALLPDDDSVDGNAPAAPPLVASPPIESDAAAAPEPFALPTLPMQLLGRDDDLVALDALLAQHRLVTVLGPGGIGKTSLAIAISRARRGAQRDGVAWVDLASVSQASMLPTAVAQALHLPVGQSENPFAALLAGLNSLQVLLVLDNAEHLIDEVARLADSIATGTPDVRLLVTSQAALKVGTERVFHLGALAVPDSGTSADEAIQYGAVALFVDQAQAADRRFQLRDDNVASVIALCRQLDGLALALKLAAARVPLLGLHGIESRLAERFKLLGGGSRSAPTRQQTLRAALDWSHGLLTAHEQIVFRRLGVFVGGFTLELAGAVASDDAMDEWAVIDTLAALVERSLVMANNADPPRYRLLESARNYALLRLSESGELVELLRRHAHAVLELFEQFDAVGWTSPDVVVLDTIGREIDNLRAALDWSTSHEQRVAVELLGASNQVYTALGLTNELRRHCVALEPAVASHSRVAGVARFWASWADVEFTSTASMQELGLKAAALYRTIGDARGCHRALGSVIYGSLGGIEQGILALREAAQLEQPDWPPRQRSWRWGAQSLLHVVQEDYQLAFVAAETAVALARAGGARRSAALCTNWLVLANLMLGKTDQAVRMSKDLISQESRWLGGLLDLSWGYLARGLLMQGDLVEARLALAEFFDQCRAAGWQRFFQFMRVYVTLALTEHRTTSAARLFGFADTKFDELGFRAPMFDRFRRETMATLQAAFDPATLSGLLAEGALLEKEAVCALTLEPC